MKTFNLLVDNREKKPFTFPSQLRIRSKGRSTMDVRLQVKKAKLETADYILGDDKANVYASPDTPGSVIIERKHSIDELATNVGKRRSRFCEILENMAKAYRYPILVYDQMPATLLKPTDHVPKPGPIFDDVQRLCLHYGVHMMILPSNSADQRRAAGEIVARTLINGEYWKGNPS